MAWKKSKREKKKKKLELVVSQPRGGFASGARGYANTFAKEFDWNSLMREAGKHGKAKAEQFVRDTAKKTRVKVGKTIFEMVKNPGAGVTNPTKVKTIMESASERFTISGSNHLFNAHKYSWKVDVGNKPFRWIKAAIVQNGSSKIKFRDTDELYDMQNAIRPMLSKGFGFNQKLQWFIESEHFGYRMDDLNSYLHKEDYSSSTSTDQVAYGGIYELRSVASITNMNQYLPVNLKVSLCRFTRDSDPNTVMTMATNPILGTQRNGAMPVINQFSLLDADTVGDSVLVNPDSPGVKSSNIFKDDCRIVQSKTVRLAAGDFLEVDYNHLCGSGIRLDRLFGYQEDFSPNLATPMTYSLLIEAHGVPVELFKNSDKDYVMKGTGIGNLQIEMKKMLTGAKAATNIANGTNDTATSTVDGWVNAKFALKVISKGQTAALTPRFNANQSTIAWNSTYSMPLMTSASSQDAGIND